MGDIAIIVEELGKKYRIGQRKSRIFHEYFKRDAERSKNQYAFPENRSSLSGNSFWALEDISFFISKGETVGIIGKNGAGKSTLLKVLSRITKPTKGRFSIDGRVSSLLKVAPLIQ